MGLTGFDSKDSGYVSMPGVVDNDPLNSILTPINGNDYNYALAA